MGNQDLKIAVDEASLRTDRIFDIDFTMEPDLNFSADEEPIEPLNFS